MYRHNCDVYLVVMTVIISYIGGQETLHCRHETLHMTLQEPTVYTQISGN